MRTHAKLIATLTRRARAAGIEGVIVSGDKDLMQLVGPHVRLWDTMRDRWVDEAAVAAVESEVAASVKQALDFAMAAELPRPARAGTSDSSQKSRLPWSTCSRSSRR